MSDWLNLDCPFCRTRFRIRAEYAHLKGRCPECGFRIAPPQPREAAPAPISASDEPLGLIPLEEEGEWPEPGIRFFEDTHAAPSYSFQDASIPSAEPLPPSSQPQTQLAQDDDFGVYRFADEPASAPASAATPPQPTSTTMPAPELKVARTEAPPPAPAAKPAFDPLFLDEIAPAGPTSTPPPPPALAATVPPPEAKLAPASASVDSPPPAAPKKNLSPAAEAALQDPGSEIYKLANAEYDPVREEPLPDHIYFRGVWGLPFAPKSVATLAWLTIGFTVLTALGAMFVALPEEGLMANFGRVALFVGLGLTGFLTLSYAAAVFFNVVTDTANGAEEINWADGGIIAWLASLPRLLWLEALALIGGVLFTQATFAITSIYGFLIAHEVCFSIFALSLLANEWGFLPINGKIFATLGTKLRYWATCWLLLVLPAFVLAILVAVTLGNWILAPLAGFSMAYFWMVRGRLLGRLGRVLLELEEPERRRRRKKRRGGTTDETETEPDPAAGWGGAEPPPKKRKKKKTDPSTAAQVSS